MDFRCQLVDESGSVLKICIPESSPAWMDILNTLCGAYPAEWIGGGSHNKLIMCTPEFKDRMKDICRRFADAENRLALISNFFNKQPDNSHIAFLREGVVHAVDDTLVAKARGMVLRANYTLCIELRAVGDGPGGDVDAGRPFTLFWFASDGSASVRPLGRGFPQERRKELVRLLKAVVDFDPNSLRVCDSFWRLGDLRKGAESREVKLSPVAGLINDEVKKLEKLDADTIVVFGVLENADINRLSDLKTACLRERSGQSHTDFYDSLMAAGRRLYLEGYRRRRFTDLGFGYRIKGRRTVCRFCEKTKAEGATFKEKPHAMSVFLGNRFLLGGGECDSCNGFLGRELEPHFYRYYLPTMISVGKTGRGKKPQIEGENFAAEIGRFKVCMEAEDAGKAHCLLNGDEVAVELNDRLPVVKADIYRCLCKYVVSLVDDGEQSLFDDTVEWIMKQRLSGNLPLTYRNERDFGCVDAPVMDIYSPLDSRTTDKAWIVSFRFLTNLWIFAVPYVKGMRNEKLDGILRRFINRHMSRIDFVREDFGHEGNSYVTTHLTHRLSPDSRLVRYPDMTPEEQHAFMNSMPERWRR